MSGAAASSGWPRTVCGHCLGPHTGSHARFCEGCVEQHARYDECSDECSTRNAPAKWAAAS